MRGRIEDLFDINTRSMWVGTFHGIAHRLLKQHWQEAKLPQNFQIMDSDDQLRLIKRVCAALELDSDRWPPKQVMWFINAQKDEGLRPDYIQETGDLYQQTMVRAYRAYEESCQRGGLVDFGELLLRAHELWLNNPALLQHYQRRFPFILVDEFQDTNTIQYAWLRVLAGDQCHVTAVGDDDQSIYGWRGAKIENIQRFDEDFKHAQMVKLEQNYRSTETILKAANAVIDNNGGRLGKNLWTEGNEGEKITLYAGFNEQDEARFVIDRIKALQSEGESLDECAILYRSNAQSRVLEECFLRENIPYRIYGGQRFYERLEIKNALAYLRLMANPFDDASMERVINTPTRGIGAKTIDSLRLYAREEGTSMWEAAQKLVVNKVLPARASTALSNFLLLIEQLKEQTWSLPLEQQFEKVINDSGLFEFHQKEKGEKAQTRIENLQELVTAAKAFDLDAESEESGLMQFLDRAALDSGDAQADEFEEAVQLMTLHSAKGLEFTNVFMVGLEENLFPHTMSMEDSSRLEEERRLCYVGITRAMVNLTITYAESRRLHGKETFNRVSRFVKEIPDSCLEEVRLKAKITRPTSFQQAPSRFAALEPNDTNFKLGQRVMHKIFGEGTILAVEGAGANARMQVNFDSEGSKWLVLQYAKLEAI